MLTIILFIVLFIIIGKSLAFGFRLTWGIFKIGLILFFLPLVIFGTLFSLLLELAPVILLVLLILCIVRRKEYPNRYN